MSKIHIEIDEKHLKKLVIDDLRRQLGDIPLSTENVTIEVKSAQNYKSEWEVANFRATFTKII